MKEFDLHLISDSTCETLISVSRSSVSHFEEVKSNEHVWAFIRNKNKVEEIFANMDKENSFIMYTVVLPEIRQYIKDSCYQYNVPFVPILSRVIRDLSSFLNISPHGIPGRYHMITDEYFERVEVINYALSHDDGQNLHTINKADIIIIGVSRTSKTPVSVYLANRGYLVANIPFVPDTKFPIDLSLLSNKLIVGLELDISRLVQIRKNRMISMNEKAYDNQYINLDSVYEEVQKASKFFIDHKMPIFNVTKYSIEEIATMIIQLLNNK